MSILALCRWLANTDFATALRGSSWVYPIVLTSHLVVLALFGGMLLMSDLRLLGFALTDLPVSQVVGRLRPWKRLGLVLMLTIGFFLFAAKAAEYWENPWFRTKVTLLLLTGLHALVFRSRVYGRTAEFDALPQPPGEAKAAAWISLILWTGIVCAGRAIGYYEGSGPF